MLPGPCPVVSCTNPCTRYVAGRRLSPGQHAAVVDGFAFGQADGRCPATCSFCRLGCCCELAGTSGCHWCPRGRCAQQLGFVEMPISKSSRVAPGTRPRPLSASACRGIDCRSAGQLDHGCGLSSGSALLTVRDGRGAGPRSRGGPEPRPAIRRALACPGRRGWGTRWPLCRPARWNQVILPGNTDDLRPQLAAFNYPAWRFKDARAGSRGGTRTQRSLGRLRWARSC